MLWGIGFKVTLISSVLLGVLVPARVRLVALRSARPARRDGPFSAHPVVGLIRPLAQLLDLIVIEASAATPKARMNVAALVTFAAPLSAFAVIPFGSRYLLAGRKIDLVVANLDGGLVWLLAAALLSIYGSMGLAPNLGDRVLSSVVKFSYATGTGLALAALAMGFGSLNPSEIAVAQDQTFSVGRFFGPALVSLQELQLPEWGIFLQPLSLLLYSVCALGMLQPTLAGDSSEPGYRLTGAQYLLVQMSEHLGNLLVASVVVALFLGGGALPYLPGHEIIGAISPYVGNGLATLLCMVVHTSAFFAKVFMVVALIDPLRRRLIGLSFEASLNLCWKGVVPVSLVNLFVTAHFLLADRIAQ